MAASFNEWEIQMTTYNTYQEAKIANPESNIFTKAGKFIGECDLGPSPHTYEYRGITKCNPADYCMAVERFLADGYRFQAGDWYIENDDSADKIDHDDVEIMNETSKYDATIYILRAAALEEKKPRTKVEYVKCEFDSAWEAIKSYETNDDLYYCASSTPTYEKMKVGNMKNLLDYSMPIKLYRRIETPMTEREAFIEALNDLFDSHAMSTSDLFNAILDSGKFKLVN